VVAFSWSPPRLFCRRPRRRPPRRLWQSCVLLFGRPPSFLAESSILNGEARCPRKVPQSKSSARVAGAIPHSCFAREIKVRSGPWLRGVVGRWGLVRWVGPGGLDAAGVWGGRCLSGGGGGRPGGSVRAGCGRSARLHPACRVEWSPRLAGPGTRCPSPTAATMGCSAA